MAALGVLASNASKTFGFGHLALRQLSFWNWFLVETFADSFWVVEYFLTYVNGRAAHVSDSIGIRIIYARH